MGDPFIAYTKYFPNFRIYTKKLYIVLMLQKLKKLECFRYTYET